jgi:hypothetical protein
MGHSVFADLPKTTVGLPETTADLQNSYRERADKAVEILLKRRTTCRWIKVVSLVM